MSSSCKPKPERFGSDIRRLLLAAEAGQKADVQAYSSGHLGPRGLNHSQSHSRETKQPLWGMSQSLDETPNPLTPWHTRSKAPVGSKKKQMKESEVWSSTGHDQAADGSSHVDRREHKMSPPKIVYCSADTLPVQPRTFSRKKSKASSEPKGKLQFSSSHSDQKGLNYNKGQLETKQQFGRQVIARQDFWAEINVALKHEKKLQQELKKLSEQSWPSRERLAVFSDVFDDVCEASSVFGRILREIKTDYDLYVNHMMASPSSLEDSQSLQTSLDHLNDKIREMELEDAEDEVCRLEQEARRALEENKRVRNELQDSEAAMGCNESVQSKRLQVLNTWREIQQLEEEKKEKLVSTVRTTATEKQLKDVKREIIRLIASNDRLKTTNKDLKDNINMVLNREKASKATIRMFWEGIQGDRQQTEKSE